MGKGKTRPKRFEFNDPIYFGQFLVIWGMSWDEAEPQMRKFLEYPKDSNELDCITEPNAAVVHNPKICKRLVIWFSEKKPGGPVVAHELFHAAFRIFDYSGIRICEDSQEPFAYYLEWLTKVVGNKVWS